ncbi:MAG TPA: FAD binding domain-containing protein [Thermoplasmata archaeon]|nr:FAD binding domain-containing protein [Thermoplasmata archaeon]
MAPFELVVPSTVEEAMAALRTSGPGGASALAGGTDLLNDLDDGRARPQRVVSLRRLPWRTLDWTGGQLTVGSTLPLRALEQDPEVARRFPGLVQAVRAVGSVALRHCATLGGNVVRSAPASDLVPVLLSLDAEVDLVGPRGDRRVPLDRFIRSSRRVDLAEGELVRSIRFPEARPSSYLWQRVRPANDISQVAVALAFSPTGHAWRVAVGGVPPRPVLLPGPARLLGSGAPGPEVVRRAAALAGEEAPFVTDRRASEEYRRRTVSALVARAVAAVLETPEFPR